MKLVDKLNRPISELLIRKYLNNVSEKNCKINLSICTDAIIRESSDLEEYIVLIFIET